MFALTSSLMFFVPNAIIYVHLGTIHDVRSFYNFSNVMLGDMKIKNFKAAKEVVRYVVQFEYISNIIIV